MSLINWKDEFSVGVPDVDHEHQQLIALINELHEKMLSPDRDVAIEEFLGEIYAQISAHFALEEKIMRERRYDQYEDHKEDHERLLDEIRDIMDEYEENSAFSDEALANALQVWFTEHFKTRDARLHSHLSHG
jgi:hemerythrin